MHFHTTSSAPFGDVPLNTFSLSFLSSATGFGPPNKPLPVSACWQNGTFIQDCEKKLVVVEKSLRGATRKKRLFYMVISVLKIEYDGGGASNTHE